MKPLLRQQLICVCLIIVSHLSNSQGIGIGTTTPHSSAAIDITHGSKGLLIPRMTTNAINAIVNPAKGLLVYDTVAHQLKVNMGTPTAVNWQNIVAKSAWNVNGNSAINAATQFLGTTDNQALRLRVNNIRAGELNPVNGNVAFGLRAGESNTAGYSNIAIGSGSLRQNSIISNTIAIGDSALYQATIGNGSDPNFGRSNIAIGSKALYSNLTGYWNTALGYNSLYANTTGWGNAAIGIRTLGSNTTGNQNTALGEEALRSNTTSSLNTAVGAASLYANDGNANTAIGSNTLTSNTGGSFNTAIGAYALQNTANSNSNTAVGYSAGWGRDNGWNNVFIGATANSNIEGVYNSIAIGQFSVVTGNNMARIGNLETVSIGGIVGWSNLSDGRFKRNVEETVKGLAFIMKLRPVNYQIDIESVYDKLGMTEERNKMEKKNAAGQDKIVHTGFIAQEVEEAAHQTGYEFSGVDKPKNENDIYGLRYADFVVPLVKAVQEQQKMIEELKRKIEELERK